MALPEGVTNIPNSFIENFLPQANPAHLAVYILYQAYKQAGLTISHADIATKLGITGDAAQIALHFWRTQGLLEDKPVVAIQSDTTEPSEPATVEARPTFSALEIERYMAHSPEIRRLFKLAEGILAKPLTYSEMNLFLSFYEWNKLPIDVIEVMLRYCVESGHRGTRYIEKVALDWDDAGISTVEQAESRIKLFNNDYRQILSAFGVTGRNPSKTEQKYMHKWLNEWAVPLDVILTACDRAIVNTGKVSFSYADKVLTSWHEESVQSIEDIEKSDEKRKQQKEQEKTEKSAQTSQQASKPKGRFSSVNRRDWDFDEIERLERMKLEQELRGGTE